MCELRTILILNWMKNNAPYPLIRSIPPPNRTLFIYKVRLSGFEHMFDNHYQTYVLLRMIINSNWKWFSMCKKWYLILDKELLYLILSLTISHIIPSHLIQYQIPYYTLRLTYYTFQQTLSTLLQPHYTLRQSYNTLPHNMVYDTT